MAAPMSESAVSGTRTPIAWRVWNNKAFFDGAFGITKCFSVKNEIGSTMAPHLLLKEVIFDRDSGAAR
jgi:hypothetical protein